MALYYSLPVDRDVYRLKIFEHAKDFSREYKYTPGQDLKRDSVVAQSKTEYLEAFLDDFEVLKPEVRLCVDLKILPMNKQAEVAILMDSNGRRITGWRTAGP